MKLRYILPLLLTASTVSANEYQTFASIDYFNVEDQSESFDAYSLSGQYFFNAKSTLGPLAEFEYINKTSNVFGRYTDIDGFDITSLGGEYFTNNFLFGAEFSFDDNNDLTNLSLGYLINDDFLIKIDATNPEHGDTVYQYSAKYNHQLDNNDYLGFEFTADDDFDNFSYSSTYFTKLQGQGYLKAGINYEDGQFDDFWSVDASYYFNKMTSVSVMLDEDKDYGFGVNHFFNENYSIGANYISANDNDTDVYRINFSARF